RILKPGGLLILACECSEGIPSGSPFDNLLRSASGPAEILEMLARPGFVRAEQWQAQIQSLISLRARVLVYSQLPESEVKAVHLEPCSCIQTVVEAELARLGEAAKVAVLPQGPLTIPYFSGGRE
ncbi:MAG: hypothetical protein ACAI34_17910, partial [Verrucomicrobium sp.]